MGYVIYCSQKTVDVWDTLSTDCVHASSVSISQERLSLGIVHLESR